MVCGDFWMDQCCFHRFPAILSLRHVVMWKTFYECYNHVAITFGQLNVLIGD